MLISERTDSIFAICLSVRELGQWPCCEQTKGSCSSTKRAKALRYLGGISRRLWDSGRETRTETRPRKRRAYPAERAAAYFFAQQFAEMLSSATFESYRVYTLCTVSRLYEALAVIDDIQQNGVNQLALQPVISELRWSDHGG